MRTRLKLEVALIAATRFIIHTTSRMMYPFLAAFARGMGVDVQAVSLAITAYNTSGAFGPFLASIADSRGRKAGILLGLVICLLAPLLVTVHPTYAFFFAAVICAGLGVAVMVPATLAYLGDEVPYERRGLAISITELSWSVAFIIGVPLMGVLIARWGWNSPYPILAGVGLVMLALFVWLLPPNRRAPANHSLLANFKRVLVYGPALAGILMGMMATASNETVNLVFGIWMGDRFGLQITALGTASMVLGFAELSGEGLAAALVDRVGKQRSIALGFLVNCAAAGSFPLLGHTLVGALAGLFFFYLSFEFLILASLPLMTEVCPSARGTLMALSTAGLSLGRALGAMAAAPLYQGWGILANGLAAIVLDGLGLLLLQWVVVRKEEAGIEPEAQG